MKVKAFFRVTNGVTAPFIYLFAMIKHIETFYKLIPQIYGLIDVEYSKK